MGAGPSGIAAVKAPSDEGVFLTLRYLKEETELEVSGKQKSGKTGAGFTRNDILGFMIQNPMSSHHRYQTTQPVITRPLNCHHLLRRSAKLSGLGRACTKDLIAMSELKLWHLLAYGFPRRIRRIQHGDTDQEIQHDPAKLLLTTSRTDSLTPIIYFA